LLFVLGSFRFIIGVSYLLTPNATAVAAMPDEDDNDAASFPPTRLLRLDQTTFRGVLQSYAVEVEVLKTATDPGHSLFARLAGGRQNIDWCFDVHHDAPCLCKRLTN
jgi:hypothetical protein